MRFQLRYLQDRGHPDEGHNIDYDMHLKNPCGLILPRYYDKYLDRWFDYGDNVDFDQTRNPNQGIKTDDWKNRSGLRLTHQNIQNRDRKPPKVCSQQEARGIAPRGSGVKPPIGTVIRGNKDSFGPPKTPNFNELTGGCGPKCTKRNCGGGCCDRFGIGPRTVGVPRTDESRCGKPGEDMSCEQRIRKARQEQGISLQPIGWYKDKFMPSSRIETTCDGCPVEDLQRREQELKPMDNTEKRVFKNEVDCRRPQYRTFPTEAAQKSSFFGLGPAIPPPNPMLLSNVPSDLLLSRKHLKDLDLSNIQHPDPDYTEFKKSQLNVDLSKPRPFDHDPARGEGLIESFISEPPQSQDPPSLKLNAGGYGAGLGSAQAAPQSQLERVRPSPGSKSGLTPTVSGKFDPEFSVRNTSLETEIMDQVRYIDEQIVALMRQISDIRQQAPQLKQRELLAKDTSDLQDVHNSIHTFQEMMATLNQLRRLLTRLQTKREHLAKRLKDMMPSAAYNRWYNKTTNTAHNAEMKIKQYHSDAPDDGIVAYVQRNFEGDGFEMKEGFYDYPHLGGIGNNNLQSIKVGKDVSVLLYERSERRGQILVYHGPRRIPIMPTLWHNRVSGIEVVKKIRVGVTVFDAPFFQGGKKKLIPGMHDYPDVGGIGVNKLSSLVIPKGFQVTLYSRPKKGGERVTYLGPQRLSFLPADWARKVQGIEVVLKDRKY
jgi:hypothetical protein